MIRHIVLLGFAAKVGEAKINRVLDKLGQLRLSVIPQIKDYSYGPNISQEHLNRGFNYGFVMEFANSEDLDIYLNHPAHKELAQYDVLPLLQDGVQSVLVFDYSC